MQRQAPPERPRKTRHRYERLNHARMLHFGCFHNIPLLRSERTCLWLIQAIERARSLHAFDPWAYCIMPDHVHLLVVPAEGSTVSAILTSIKQSVANKALAWTREHAPAFLDRLAEQRGNSTIHRFGQRGGGYDRNLWSPDHIWSAIEYIHANPVAAGLCQSPLDWRWSSVSQFTPGAAGPEPSLRVDRRHIPPDPR